MSDAALIGYEFEGELWCLGCIVLRMVQRGIAAPGALDMPVDSVMHQCGEAMGFDMSDPWSIDSSEFPVPVWDSELLRWWECGAILCPEAVTF